MSAPRKLETYAIGQENISLAYGIPYGGAAAGDDGTYLTAQGMPFDTCELNLENSADELDKYVGEIDDRYVDNTMQRYTGRCSAQVWADWNAAVTEAESVWGLCGIARSNYVSTNFPQLRPGASPYGTADPADTYAYTFFHWDAAAAKLIQSTGVKADTFRIACNGAGGGAASKLMVDMDLVGQGEKVISGVSARPAWTFPTGESFQYSDASFFVDGTTDPLVAAPSGYGTGGREYNVLDFTIEGRNNLQLGPPNSNKQIMWASAGGRKVTLTFTVRCQRFDLANFNVYDYIQQVRDFRKDLAFSAKFYRSGKTPNTLTINMPSLVVVSAVRQGGMNEVQTVQVTCKGTSYLYSGYGNDAIYVCTSTV